MGFVLGCGSSIWPAWPLSIYSLRMVAFFTQEPRLVPAVRSRTGERSFVCLLYSRAVATSPPPSVSRLVSLLLLLFRQHADMLVNLRAQLTAVDAAVVGEKHKVLRLARLREEGLL